MTDKVKDRPEDQKMPVATEGPHMHDIAAQLLDARKQLGISRYGQPLQPFNGRNAVQDVLEEVLDSAAYIAQVAWEQEHPEETYVGRIIQTLTTMSATVDFRGVFVPDAVVELLENKKVRVMKDEK